MAPRSLVGVKKFQNLLFTYIFDYFYPETEEAYSFVTLATTHHVIS